MLVRGLSDLDKPAKGLDWSVGQTAAHLIAAISQNADLLKGTRESHPLADIAAINRERLALISAHSPGELADGIFRAATTIVAVAKSYPVGRKVRWVDDVEQELGTVLAAVLGDILVHGFDIARSVDQPWEIRRQHAAQVIAGTAPASPLFVNQAKAAGFKGSCDVRVRGGVGFVARFDDGRLTIEPPGQQGVDCQISADPVAMMLVFYGRVGQLGQVMKGKMVSWGRKPWLGLKFKSLIIDP